MTHCIFNLGEWAGWGLRNICGWRTDVCEDYLKSKCFKLILQDNNDEVIAHPASLKSGISCRLLLNDRWHTTKSLPRRYQIALFSKQALSTVLSTSAANDLLMKAENSPFLPEKFIEHILAIILYIHKLATESKAASPVGLPETDSPSTGLLTGEPAHDSYQSHRRDRMNLAMLQSSMVGLWMSLAKIDGGGGYCLSHVITKGYDVLRAWICDLVIWNNQLLGVSDRSLSIIGSLQSSINEIQMRLPALVFTGCPLTKDDVEFLLRGLKLLHQRSKLHPQVVDNNNNNTDVSESGKGNGGEVGKVVSLNCGHNGWPAPLALAALSNSIRQAGFDVS